MSTIMSLDSLLATANAIEIDPVSMENFDLEAVKTVIQMERETVPAAESELIQLETQMEFLMNSEKQLVSLLAKQDEPGFVLAAESTLATMGMKFDDVMAEAEGAGDKKDETAKKGFGQKMKDGAAGAGKAIVVLLDKIRTALMKFYAERFSAHGRRQKAATKLAAAAKGVTEVQDKEVSWTTAGAGKTLADAGKNLTVIEKEFTLLKMQKAYSDAIGDIESGKIADLAGLTSVLDGVVKAPSIDGLEIKTGVFGVKFTQAKGESKAKPAVGDFKAVADLAERIATLSKSMVDEASSLQKKSPTIDMIKASVAGLEGKDGADEKIKLLNTLANNWSATTRSVSAFNSSVMSSIMAMLAAYMSAAKGAKPEDKAEDKAEDKK